MIPNLEQICKYIWERWNKFEIWFENKPATWKLGNLWLQQRIQTQIKCKKRLCIQIKFYNFQKENESSHLKVEWWFETWNIFVDRLRKLGTNLKIDLKTSLQLENFETCDSNKGLDPKKKYEIMQSIWILQKGSGSSHWKVKWWSKTWKKFVNRFRKFGIDKRETWNLWNLWYQQK